MRFRLFFTLEEEHLPQEYRKMFLSFMKKSLTEYENALFFKDFFDGANVKRYCFSVRLPPCTFEKNYIKLSEKFLTFLVSTHDTRTGMILYNAFLTQKLKSFPLEQKNRMILTAIRPENHKPISRNKITGKMLMPLCVRFHVKETNEDCYFTHQDENFQEKLRFVLENQVQTILGIEGSIFEGFSFTPIQMKKTMIRHYGKMIPVSLGTFEMTGDPLLMNYFFDEGFGSRRSSGFGAFEIF